MGNHLNSRKQRGHSKWTSCSPNLVGATINWTLRFLQRRQRVYFRFLFCEVKSTLITKCAYSSFSECYKYGNDYWEDVCIMNRWMIDWSIMGYHRHSLHHTGAVNRSVMAFNGPYKAWEGVYVCCFTRMLMLVDIMCTLTHQRPFYGWNGQNWFGDWLWVNVTCA